MTSSAFQRRACWYDNPLLRLGWGHWVQRSLLQTLDDLIGPAEQIAILDVPCGTAEILQAIALAHPVSRVVGIDASWRMLEQGIAKVAPLNNGQLVTASATHLPQPDQCFDVVVVCDGLHHFAEPTVVLDELARVVRPGGAIVIVDPRFDSRWERGFHNAFRWLDRPEAYYARGDVEALLMAAGLRPERYARRWLKHYLVARRPADGAVTSLSDLDLAAG